MEPLLTVVSVFWWMFFIGFIIFVGIPVGIDVASAFKSVIKEIKERFHESRADH